MKRLISITLCLLLVSVAGVFALTQDKADDLVNEILQTNRDYADLISNGDKLDTMVNLIAVGNSPNTRALIFRAIYRSQGFKLFSALRNGRTCINKETGTLCASPAPHMIRYIRNTIQ